MNEVKLATCHCIIAHPSKPKFMVIKHRNGWFPPIVEFPGEGFVGHKVQMIADGVMNKYGLKVTVLRHLVESADYHCIELEQHSQQSARKLEAVWVGAKEYKQFRSSKPGQADPFADWLTEAQKRRIPKQRPPWERRGWFRKAATWIEHELDSHDIQMVGSVRQYSACWHSASILRVRTSQGMRDFKACWNAPPREAALTAAIADRWPDLVPAPLSFDTERNWMLMPDLREAVSPVPGDDCPALAAALAKLQIESSRDPDEWNGRSCRNRGVEALADFLGSVNKLTAMLRMGGGGLSDDELLGLNPLISRFRTACGKLGEYGIPETLVHPTFGAPNVLRRDGGFWIVNWSGAVISHPFFSIHALIRSTAPQSAAGAGTVSAEDDGALVVRISDAYLAPYTEFESPDRLQAALALTAELFDVWKLCLRSHQLAYIEPNSVAMSVAARAMQNICRTMIESQSKAGKTP
jgi:hypothetical protein